MKRMKVIGNQNMDLLLKLKTKPLEDSIIVLNVKDTEFRQSINIFLTHFVIPYLIF